MRIIYCIFIIALISCNNKSTGEALKEEPKIDKEIMKIEDKFDFNEYTIRELNNTTDYYKEDGSYIELYVLDNENPLVFETPPPPSFITIIKKYHPNGVIKEIRNILGEGVVVGITNLYDEKRIIIKSLDEDVKFEDVKPNDILHFMEKEGLINLKTGEGRFDDSGRPKFELFFSSSDMERGKDIKYNLNNSLWQIKILSLPYNAYYETKYIIDGKTGDVLEKTTKQRLPIE